MSNGGVESFPVSHRSFEKWETINNNVLPILGMSGGSTM